MQTFNSFGEMYAAQNARDAQNSSPHQVRADVGVNNAFSSAESQEFGDDVTKLRNAVQAAASQFMAKWRKRVEAEADLTPNGEKNFKEALQWSLIQT